MPSPVREREAAGGRFAALRRRYEPQLSKLGDSDLGKAAGLAGAMIANNVIALGSTIVFARLLKGDGYGSLAALVSYFLILSVAGQALQVATAREGVLGHLGVGAGLIATLKRWTRSMVIFTAVLTVISVLLRAPIAAAVGVKHDQWAAAIGLLAGGLWLELSILRGALQGVGDYKTVGLSLVSEQGVRLIAGAILAAALTGAGLGVTGAYLGTPISFTVICVYCAIQLRHYARRADSATAAPATAHATIPLWTHVRRAWAPIAGLIVIAVLQNIDIIAAKHRFNGVHNLASSYAATAVAAKVLIWVAMGAGFYLVPETSRRRAAGEDTRPVLGRALAIVLVCAVPVLLIFAFGSTPLLRAAFGGNRLRAVDSLFLLGVAFTALAATYLAIQYMLALKRTAFLIPMAIVAIAEPVLLLQASRRPTGFAAVVLGIQAVGAVVALGLALRPERGGRIPPSAPGSDPAGSTARSPEPEPEPAREPAGLETA
jgi:O-antigen/teichoic acid export membrane protein